ncbi:Acetyltransferase (GNAT) family protein [Modestobacter sp. DSM 44400]|uniref:GNAT family N-acetyltransferase n=1 Tax=Modestobacter sp. DSM 44400 TaxID=1550230 RepID=UPI000895636E|nr:GNAT family N-acetyltransferase [Modestobacter sp. DSM 44400]SDX60499.1 Acetyltransferase (GNAT) family protein [Modestobacter sp. DSM 44400]
MTARLTVTAATADDWPVLRALRLAALADAPDAFDSSLAVEQGFGEEDWRARLRPGGQRLAWVDGVPVGVARGIRHRVEHHLVSMWVSPPAAGAGWPAGLVEGVVDWAREQCAPRLYLWLVGENEAARRLYLRCGFALTGPRQPLPSRPWQVEHWQVEQQYALEPS